MPIRYVGGGDLTKQLNTGVHLPAITYSAL
jgi:hypothetical protein